MSLRGVLSVTTGTPQSIASQSTIPKLSPIRDRCRNPSIAVSHSEIRRSEAVTGSDTTRSRTSPGSRSAAAATASGAPASSSPTSCPRASTAAKAARIRGDHFAGCGCPIRPKRNRPGGTPSRARTSARTASGTRPIPPASTAFGSTRIGFARAAAPPQALHFQAHHRLSGQCTSMSRPPSPASKRAKTLVSTTFAPGRFRRRISSVSRALA